MRKLLAVLALGAAAVACSEQATSPQAGTLSLGATHTTDNLYLPFDGTFEALCGGEDVYVDGVIHFVQLETVSVSGNHSSSWMGQPQGLKGVGVTSGLPYKFTGVTRETFNIQGDAFPLTDTFVDRFRVIGPRGFQYYIETTSKVTINGVGNIVVEFNKTGEDCR